MINLTTFYVLGVLGIGWRCIVVRRTSRQTSRDPIEQFSTAFQFT
jgi:hypothetical protein